MVAHVAPEAVRGGPIAALADGDEITIDVDAGRLDVALSDEEIAERVAAYVRPPRADEHIDVAIRKYAKLVGSAAEGAVARWSRCARRARPLLGQEVLEQRVERAGRSSIAMWPVSSKTTLRESGISSANTSASCTVIRRSLLAPHDQRRAGDLGSRSRTS